MPFAWLRAVVFVLAASASLAACSSSDGVTDECSVTAPTSCTQESLRYEDVAPIFQQRCASCHGATKGGPWPLNTYSNVADWADTVRDELVTCAMPPPDMGTGLTNAERLKILDWLRCDYPQ